MAVLSGVNIQDLGGQGQGNAGVVTFTIIGLGYVSLRLAESRMGLGGGYVYQHTYSRARGTKERGKSTRSLCFSSTIPMHARDTRHTYKNLIKTM